VVCRGIPGRPSPNPPWLIYALGGGWGHLNRAIALGRVAAQRQAVTILTNSPYAAHAAAFLYRKASQAPMPTLQILPSEWSQAAIGEAVRSVLLTQEYGCLIVDTFPRGLGGELVDILPELLTIGSLPIHRVLVHRDLQPTYVRAKAVRSFVTQWYDQVIIPGDGEDLPLASLANVSHTPPWFVCNAAELPSPETVRSRLAVPISLFNPSIAPDSSAVLIVCAAGQQIEQAFYGRLVSRLIQAFPDVVLRCLAAACPPACPPAVWIAHYPGIELFAAADVVIGSGGYNTVHECAALNIPLISFTFPRLYDRQWRRAQHYSHWVQTEEAAIAWLQKFLRQRQPQRLPSSPYFSNGAVQAVAKIEHGLSQSRL
jgi:hypothetical protein